MCQENVCPLSEQWLVMFSKGGVIITLTQLMLIHYQLSGFILAVTKS